MNDNNVTILVTTSPHFRCPDTEMIRKTIKIYRDYLPHAEVLILADGVREEQKKLEHDYRIYLDRLEKWIKRRDNMRLYEFGEFYHQAGMVKRAFDKDMIKTPLIMFAEHDFPIHGEIPFEDIIDSLLKGKMQLIRFYLETDLIPEHRHLFLDKKPVVIDKIPMIRTGQWSQRPHIARLDYYKQIINLRFTDQSRTYIEDGVHGYHGELFALDPYKCWANNRMAIYHPDGNISRCYHLDGRGEEQKYEIVQ